MGKRYTAVITVTEIEEDPTVLVSDARKVDRMVKAEKSSSEISRMVVRSKTLTGLSKRMTEVSALIREDTDE